MNTLHRWTLLAAACVSACSMASAQQVAPAAPAPKKPVKAVAAAPAPLSPREAELAQRLDQLSTELEKVKSQLAELKQQVAQQPAVAAAPVVPVPAPAAIVQTAAVPVNGDVAPEGKTPATSIGGYAEFAYNHYNQDKSRNEADLHRFVLLLEHRLDPKTKLVSELEVEHAVASKDDVGEIEVEQAYVERQLSQQWALRAGLFLIPAGLLNENHEPTSYFGVERNFVETAIIPSTWREGGIQFVGNLNNGLTLQAGISTNFNASAWDSTNSETADSPLGSVHQEMSKAHAKDPAVFAALNWRGVPGLLLGGSYFTGNAGQGQESSGLGLRITLWDLHARYNLGDLDLSALYARGTFGGSADFNTLHSLGNDYPMPERFEGSYVQAAYKVWSSDDLALTPFVRVEHVNTRKSFAFIGDGITGIAAPTEHVYTVGANFNVGQGLVFKADVQRFKQNKDDNRVDLGMGWNF